MIVDPSSSRSVPRPLKAASAPILPRSSDPAPAFGGFVFCAEGSPPAAPGVFALTLAIEGTAYPILIGAADDLALAIETAAAALPTLPGELGRCWMERATARQRAHIARDLVGKYNPPLNVDNRTARAASEIAALTPDLAASPFTAPPAEGATAEVSEDALGELVRAFYAKARQDPLIGPVFEGAVGDWQLHHKIVQDFWSRALLDTARYSGFPYAAHISLGLKPKSFERWLAIFAETAGRTLPPEAARRAILKVEMMSKCFQAGLFPPPGAPQ